MLTIVPEFVLACCKGRIAYVGGFLSGADVPVAFLSALVGVMDRACRPIVCGGDFVRGAAYREI